ncbi:MAG: hypothetical protein HXS54_18630 [Theionarchaea archaeon]|nr:hypothetical protein [Theionarchaea archaeon]
MRDHVFDANVIYHLYRIDGIPVFARFAESSKIRLVTTELVMNEMEKHDNEKGQDKVETLIRELGDGWFVNVTEHDVKNFFHEIGSLSILKQSPYSWGIYNRWNIGFDPSSFIESEGVFYHKRAIERRDLDKISPADITLMAYLIKLYNEYRKIQSIYTDDTKIEIIGKKSKMYETIRYIDLLNLLLKENLSFSMFIEAVNDFIQNSKFSLPLRSNSPEATTKTLRGIEDHIVNFTSMLIEKIRDKDELERRKKAEIVNYLKNSRDVFRDEFRSELRRYSSPDYDRTQKDLKYLNLRKIILKHENNIRRIVLPISDLINDMNLGWVIE